MSIIWLRACVLTENCLIAASLRVINPLPSLRDRRQPVSQPFLCAETLPLIADFFAPCHEKIKGSL
jgi:hypothetical protein